jgi:hypothetical protein
VNPSVIPNPVICKHTLEKAFRIFVMAYKATPPTGTDGANLVTQSGITTGRVTAWCRALDIDEQTLAEAVHATGQPVVDTAQSKPREKHDRPFDPSLRHIALTADHAARVLAYVAEADEPERAVAA